MLKKKINKKSGFKTQNNEIEEDLRSSTLSPTTVETKQVSNSVMITSDVSRFNLLNE